MTRRVGFIGLGMMGLPMLQNLASAPGLEIRAYDVSSAPLQQLRQHPSWDKTLRAAASLDELSDCEVVITMLPNSRITNEVVKGAHEKAGLTGLLARGAVLVDMGSSNPGDTLALASRLKEDGIALVDAPVSGAVAKARTGSLSILVGGADDDVQRVRPLLERMGTTIIRTGAVGSAHAMKALNNYVYAAGLLAASEALLIANRLGLNVEVLTDVLNASSGRNVATETKLRQFMIPRTFDGGFAIRLMAKDLATAEAMQALAGVDAPQLALCNALWRDAIAALDEHADNTEIYRFLERRQRERQPS